MTEGLKERFEKFIRTLDGFEDIDQLLRGGANTGKRRADYLLGNRSIIIEQKTLVRDPADAPQKYVERLMREEKILVFGTLSTDAIFSRMPDGEKHKARMFDNLTRQIEAGVTNADKQTRDTREIFDLPNALGVLVLLNLNAKTLVPDAIRYGLERTYMKTVADTARASVE